MGDVADILGITASQLSAGRPSKSQQLSKKKPEGMSREVFSLLGPEGYVQPRKLSTENIPSLKTKDLDAVPPIAPTSFDKSPKSFSRKIRALAKRRAKPWRWTGFSNSARQDGLQLKHWQKRNQVLPDYPFARFNKGCVVVRYENEDEYNAIISQEPVPVPSWTKAETDYLLDLCEQYDLRWDVILDRYEYKTSRSIVDLKFRYYHIAKCILRQRKQHQQSKPRIKVEDIPPVESGCSLKSRKEAKLIRELIRNGRIPNKARIQVENELVNFKFNYENEKERLAYLDHQHSKTYGEEREEQRILAEMKKLDMQIRRLQKEKRAKKQAFVPGSASHRDQKTLLESAISKEEKKIKTAHRRIPVFLRSTRLLSSVSTVGVGQRMLKKISNMLTELGVPERPVPTALVCDSYDKLRQDLVKLLTLKTHASKLRMELSKLKGIPISTKTTINKSERNKKRKGSQFMNQGRNASKKLHQQSQSLPSSVKSTMHEPSPSAKGATAFSPTSQASNASARTSGRTKKRKIAK